MRDARPCRDATATRGGDKQEPDAPPLSFPHGVRRRAALLVLEAASQVAVDRGCNSERSLRSEESTRSDLPAASAQAGQRERNTRMPGGRSSFPLPLGGEGRVRGGRWRHLEPLGASPLCLRLRLRGASPLSLILSPGGGEESGKGGACPTSVIPAWCAFLFPSPLGGRGEGEGGRWRHPEPLGARPPLSFPRSARRRPALLVLEAASQVTVDRGRHSERSLRSEESARGDLPAASAQAGGVNTPLEDKSLRVDPSLRSG